MKKKDVEVGATYVAKVSGKLAHVRVTCESLYGGWEAVNMDTGRQVHVRSAARLRYKMADKPRSIAAHAQGSGALDFYIGPGPELPSKTELCECEECGS